MHREISTVDDPFRGAAPLALYALTALVGGLLAADLWPLVAAWLKGQGVETYSWARELFGFRYALLAASYYFYMSWKAHYAALLAFL